MSKRINLSGVWDIKVTQQLYKKTVTYYITSTLEQVGDRVIGDMIFDLKNMNLDLKTDIKKRRKLKLLLHGQISKNQLRFNYDNANKSIKHLGCAIITIESQSKMSGVFIGYGPESKAHAVGSMKYRKRKESLT